MGKKGYIVHGGKEERKWPFLGPQAGKHCDNGNWLRIAIGTFCINETTWRYIPQGCRLHTHRRENLKSLTAPTLQSMKESSRFFPTYYL
jgi:hypothetical protein